MAGSVSLHYNVKMQLWVALCIATNSSAWLSTAVLVTNMRNFPQSRGTVAGILKGYGGLSAAVFTEFYGVLLRHSSCNLLMFLAVGIPLLCFSMMYFVRPSTPASGEDLWEHSHFLFIQATSIAFGLFLLSTTLLGDILPFTVPISFIVISVMNLLLMAPLFQSNFLFSGLLVGYIYDQEAAKQHGVALLKLSVPRLGPECFRLTFLVLAGLCGLGVILRIILTIRIKPVYQMLYSGGSFRQPQSSDY